jgi:hypothetical protein
MNPMNHYFHYFPMNHPCPEFHSFRLNLHHPLYLMNPYYHYYHSFHYYQMNPPLLMFRLFQPFHSFH